MPEAQVVCLPLQSKNSQATVTLPVVSLLEEGGDMHRPLTNEEQDPVHFSN
jgi:hypothetical protein